MENEGLVHISIAILQRPIDLWIQQEHEVYYREAEKRINERANEFAKKWNFSDQQDLLSKLLLEQAVNNIAKEEKLNTYDETLIPRMEKLIRLADQMNEALEALENSAVEQPPLQENTQNPTE